MGRHGENIYKRKDGRWEARVITGYSLEGKACYRYLYGRTYQEVKSKKMEFLTRSALGKQPVSHNSRMKMTFRELMMEWLDSRRGSIKESSYANYMNLLEQHILPELGRYSVSAVTTDILDGFLKAKLDSGRCDHQGGLAAKTVLDIRSVLLMGLEYARRQKYPCSVENKLFCPRNMQSDTRVLTRGEQQKLEQILFQSANPFEAGVLIALYGGLRIGEVCALQWGDIDFEDRLVYVSKTVIRMRNLSPDPDHKTKVVIERPKTACSVRLVPLPSFLLRHIAKFRSEQEFYILTGSGSFTEPRVCLEKYKHVLKEAGIESLTFHTLRHTFATRCVESGIDIKSLSEILGHADVSTTLQRYVHPSIEQKKKQIESLESISIYRQDNGQI
ncbi:MAG: tyrosine-type recombinase/integrase [Lachnospiraceae bacterium]|nr:tyrosine-type recombinase/integrase [Lachnospiraceae bacterium]